MLYFWKEILKQPQDSTVLCGFSEHFPVCFPNEVRDRKLALCEWQAEVYNLSHKGVWGTEMRRLETGWRGRQVDTDRDNECSGTSTFRVIADWEVIPSW